MIANQGGEWMDIPTTSKRRGISKKVKQGNSNQSNQIKFVYCDQDHTTVKHELMGGFLAWAKKKDLLQNKYANATRRLSIGFESEVR